MARPRKRWSKSEGRYGERVRIWEPALGAPLRWDYRDPSCVTPENPTGRTRPEVAPMIVVRASKNDAVDPVLEKRAIDLCKKKLATMTLTAPAPEQPEALTLGKAYALYFDPRRKALPPSKEARAHHTASRAFWEVELGKDTPFDRIAPADVWGALLRLKEEGHIPTAEKRMANLRTLYTWLTDRMGYDDLKNPLRTLKKKDLVGTYKPRRPRYTTDEVEKLVEASKDMGARFHLFTVLMADSGARAIQVRSAMRSGLNIPLEPPPPKDFGPHGWLLLAGVKHQDAMLLGLTLRQQAAIDAALATYLSEWEAAYQAGTLKDYPLIPGGRDDRELVMEPISDTALRKDWITLQAKAEVPMRQRLAFHGSRRSWSDDIYMSEGLDTLTSAGAWKNRKTPEVIYLSARQYAHIDKARKHREKP